MHNLHQCAVCDSEDTEVILFADRIKAGRKVVTVHGLRKLACHDCGAELVPEEFHDSNLELMREAIATTKAAVTPSALRTFRTDWDLSQREASKVFGAGSASFGKWESGQSVPSTPTALLLQCAMRFPQVLIYLAALSSVVVADRRRSGRVHAPPPHAYAPVRLDAPVLCWSTPQSKSASVIEPPKPDWDQERIATQRTYSRDRLRIAA